MTDTFLTEDEFDTMFTPIVSLHDPDCYQYHYNIEADKQVIIDTPINQIWTCVEGDDGMSLISGTHVVNHMYYVITEEAVPEGVCYIIEEY